MPELRKRRNDPAPELAYQEIYFPDDSDWGTGCFRFRVKRSTIVPPEKRVPKAIAAIAVNPPRFQISVSINPGSGEIAVLLGYADGSSPCSTAVFCIQTQFDSSQSHDFEVAFREWEITLMMMDGQELMRK